MEGGENGVKKQESLGVKLKIGALVGNRGGKTTPSPTWRFGLPQEDDSMPQNLIFQKIPTISARKLGANLWEVHPRSHQHHRSRKKAFDQPVMENLERNDHATPLESPGSSSSVEMSPYRPEITRNGSPHLKGRSRDSSYNLKTSTEFVKVLNRIWSLEEQHASNRALMKAMKKELDHTRLLNKELLREKKRFHEEMDEMLRHVQVKEKDGVFSMRKEVEEERSLRKHSESLCDKLAQELSEVKSSYSNAVKELERERKARMLLEDLCDEFAKGIREYEREMHSRKSRFGSGWTTQDRLILHLSEAWLDERMQMKLAETHSGLTDEDTIVDKLSLEIETFLKTQKFKKPTRRKLRGCSLESFHLIDPGSAPQNRINEEDFSALKSDSKDGPSSDDVKKKLQNAVIVSQMQPEEQQEIHPVSMEPIKEHKAMDPVPEALESSSRWKQGTVKENTLMAKLLEARMESRNSSSRISKVPNS